MSTIRVDNFGPSAGGTTYSARGIAKAWVNFNGESTIATRDSENVSSLTDNGTGDYTVNLTNAFGAADYFVSFSGTPFNANYPRNCGLADISHLTSSSSRFFNGYSTSFGGGTFQDMPYAGLSIHGDLA